MVKQATQTLAEALKAGHSKQLQDYLKVMGRFPNYSIGNQILIALQMPTASKVCGYRTWRSLGRQVRRGEKGISIRAPVVIHAQSPQSGVQPEHEDPNAEQRTPHLVCFATATVFDISQTYGKDLPEFARVSGDPRPCSQRLKEFVAGLGIRIEYADWFGPVYGASCGGRVLVKSGLSPAEELSVILHELAHELLHRQPNRPTSKTVLETEAEAVAFVVGTAMNLDCLKASTDYVHLCNGSANTLVKSLERIQATARRIIEAVVTEPELVRDRQATHEQPT